jgi:hypothetical protein
MRMLAGRLLLLLPLWLLLQLARNKQQPANR